MDLGLTLFQYDFILTQLITSRKPYFQISSHAEVQVDMNVEGKHYSTHYKWMPAAALEQVLSGPLLLQALML